MTKKEALCRRKAMEKKYTKEALAAGLMLERGHDGRFFSVSPGKIHHLEGEYNGYIDYEAINEYSRLSEIIHNHSGVRQDVERKINSILHCTRNVEWRTYELKQYFSERSFEKTNEDLEWFDFKKINKLQHKQLNNLFKKFAELSKDEHYKLTKEEVKLAKKICDSFE